MERREFVKVAAGTAVAMAAGQALAKDHDHDHSKMKKVEIKRSGLKPAHLKKVADTAHECAASAQVCLAHTTRELAAGHTMMAPCQAVTANTISICESLAAVANLDSIPKAEMVAFVKSCMAICELCEAECKKHKHKECKDCAKACRDCIKACKKLVG